MKSRASAFIIIVFALACNPWMMRKFFLPSGTNTTPALSMFIILIEFLLIVVGIALWRTDSSDKRKKLRSNILVLMVTLCCIEIALHIVHRYHPLTATPTTRVPLSSSIFRDKPWAPQVMKELRQLVWKIDLYDGWQTKEFHGTYTNIDSDGARKTLNSSPDTSKNLLYMFGGSTMWGFYVPDDQTIPSYTSSALDLHGQSYSVRNYGERAYSFTQDVMRLVTLLRKGHRPSTVVFYDGVNDVLATYFIGEAGESWLTPEINEIMQQWRGPTFHHLGIEMKFFLEKHLMLYILFERAVNGLFHLSPMNPEYSSEQLARLSNNIAHYYRDSYDLLDKLSQTYRFNYFCLLQPVIYSKRHMTEEEINSDPEVHDESLKKLFLMTYDKLRQERLPHSRDISNVLDSLPETVFADYCHLSAEGNQIVANKIAEIISRDTLSTAQ